MRDDIVLFETIDRDGPQDCRCEFDLSGESFDPDLVERGGPVRMAMTAEKGDQPREYRASGTIELSAELRCGRCLEPYPFATQSAFAVTLRPRSEGSEAEVEVSPEELDVEFYDEPQLNLRELAREQVELTIPMKTLCSESCLGLCTHCGANLNRGSCECSEGATDSRWSALSAIRDEIARKKEN